MGIEDEDFIMRQTKELAAGLAKFLSREATDEILNFGAKQADDKEKNDKNFEKKLKDENIKKEQTEKPQE